jgi:hypothetical protein
MTKGLKNDDIINIFIGGHVVENERESISQAQVRRNFIRKRKSEIDMSSMRLKIMKNSKWINFKIKRQKVIDEYLKVKRV